MGAGEQVDRYVSASQGRVPEGRARGVLPRGPTETGCAAGLRGCPKERLPSRLCTPGRGGAGPVRRLPAQPRCLPWGLTFHFSPSSKGQAGPTSQTCKLRPENLQRYLGAQWDCLPRVGGF